MVRVVVRPGRRGWRRSGFRGYPPGGWNVKTNEYRKFGAKNVKAQELQAKMS